MNKVAVILFSLAVVAAGLSSCGGSKKSVGTKSDYKEESVEEPVRKSLYSPQTVADSNTEWQDATISGTMTVGTTSSLRSSVQIKMIKGKSVSISIRPLLGIEMGKIYFSGDTVTVVDKYHKVYVQESIGGLLGGSIDVATLQSLLLSRPFLIGDGGISDSNRKKIKGTESDANGNWVLSPKEQDGVVAYNFDMKGNNISHFNVIVPPAMQYSMNFSRYMNTPKGLVAGLIDAEIPLPGITVMFELQYGGSIKWDSGITDAIAIPANCDKLDFADVMKLISGR